MALTRRNFLQTSAGAAALAGLGMPARAQTGPFVVNMYGGKTENEWRGVVMPKFSELIGRPFEIDVGLGLAWTSNFRTAGAENPPYPTVMMNERYIAMLRDDDFFETLTPELVPNLADVIDTAVLKDSTSVTGFLAPLLIAYRTDMIDEPPRGWADLWHPRFRGLLGMYSITNSAAAMLAFWAGEHFGSGWDDFDTALAKFRELAPFPQLAFTAQLNPLFTQGQVAIAPLDLVEVMNLQAAGVPVDYVVPEEGMMVFDQSFSIFKNSPDKETGAKYIDFVLSPEIQLWVAENWYMAPVNRTVQLTPELDRLPMHPEQLEAAIRFDWTAANDVMADLTDLWSRTL